MWLFQFRSVHRGMQVLLWGLLAAVLLRTAWVCDDAFITLRCVDNAVAGHGLTYNVVDRVQAFTHPLWALMLLPLHALCHDGPLEVMWLSWGLSMAALLVAGRALQVRVAWWALPLLAIASKAWVEYASSGLENALAYLLVALFVLAWWQWQRDQGSLLRLALLASLLLLTRMDLLLLVAPALGLACWQSRSWRMVGQLALGFLPFITWEAFAIIYYGFPFPNTAYAKLGAEVPTAELWHLGWAYLGDSLGRDPVTLLVVGLAAGWGLARRSQWPLALGILFYIFYVVRIGGDFMSGRFFAVPYMLALLLVGRMLAERKRVWGLLVATATVAALLSPTPMLLSGGDYPGHMTDAEFVGPTEVADERAFYYPSTGLLRSLGRPNPQVIDWRQQGEALHRLAPQVTPMGAVGMIGYYAGPQQHILDLMAITDPLMARLPAIYDVTPRAGHFLRRLPFGYFESVTTAQNHIGDPAAHALYDRLRLITRGPLFSAARWEAIFKENLGLQPKIDLWAYRFPQDAVLEPKLDEQLTVLVEDHRSAAVVIPQTANRVSLQLRSTVGCQMIWLQGHDALGGEILEFDGKLRSFDIPHGADRILFLHEAQPYQCEVSGIQFLVMGK